MTGVCFLEHTVCIVMVKDGVVKVVVLDSFLSRYCRPKFPLLNLQIPPGVVTTNPLCGSYITWVSSLTPQPAKDKMLGGLS